MNNYKPTTGKHFTSSLSKNLYSYWVLSSRGLGVSLFYLFLYKFILLDTAMNLLNVHPSQINCHPSHNIVM